MSLIKKTITISKQQADEINRLLNLSREEFAKIDTFDGEILNNISCVFDDGNELEIRLIATDVDCYLDVVLFEKSLENFQREIGCLDAIYSLDKTFEIESNETSYELTLELE